VGGALNQVTESDPSLFGDVAFYRALRQELLPELRTWPSVRVWHAGIGSGEEIYATSIVLREEGLARRSTLWATDPEPERVRRAERAEFSSRGYADSAAAYRAGGGRSLLEEYSSVNGDSLVFGERLKERLVFFQHDPGAEASFAEFQLIVYRARSASLRQRERALEVAHHSLSRFGILVLKDGSRIEQHPLASSYQALLPGRWAFRRLA
jgi:chemotaxis protein methyltransferase CheR